MGNEEIEAFDAAYDQLYRESLAQLERCASVQEEIKATIEGQNGGATNATGKGHHATSLTVAADTGAIAAGNWSAMQQRLQRRQRCV